MFRPAPPPAPTLLECLLCEVSFDAAEEKCQHAKDESQYVSSPPSTSYNITSSDINAPLAYTICAVELRSARIPKPNRSTYPVFLPCLIILLVSMLTLP